MATTCKDIMTSDPKCVTPEESVQKAAQLMKDEDVGPIPVISDEEQKKLVGILTDRDLSLKVVAEAKDAVGTPVREVMTEDVTTCEEDTDIEEVIQLMEKKIRRIPIVDKEKASGLGIISQADIARKATAQETGELVEKISQ